MQQSTLPARGATRLDYPYSHQPNVSIHAPRTGSDTRPAGPGIRRSKFQSTLPARGATLRPRRDVPSGRCFNPRSPRGERLRRIQRMCAPCLFQSTLPARGATTPPDFPYSVPEVSIHAPRTGSDGLTVMRYGAKTVSIHAPRAGSDGAAPTPLFSSSVSIHAPRAGSDAEHPFSFPLAWRFNPRSPRGERPW